MKNLKIDILKMLADMAAMQMKERGEYISEALRQARDESDVSMAWVAEQIELSAKRAQAGAKGGSAKKAPSSPKPKKQKPVEPAPKPTKIPFAKDVWMLQSEYDTLEKTHGKSIATRSVQILQEYKNYKASKGEVVDYKSDYLAINKWVIDKALKEEAAKRHAQTQNLRLEKREGPEEFASMDF